MKHITTILLAAGLCMCLSGCSQLQDNGIRDLYTWVWQLETNPALGQAIIGAEGGDIEVVVFVRPEDRDIRKLKNDYLSFGLQDDAAGKKFEDVFPFATLKGREQIDDYSVRYKFSLQKNDTGNQRVVEMRVYDTSYVKNGAGAGVGTIQIIQTAE